MTATRQGSFSVSEARAQLADLLQAVVDSGERAIIERYGRPIGVIVSPEELRILDAIEDRFVQIEADRVRAEGDDGRRYSTEEVLRFAAAAPSADSPPAVAAADRISDKVNAVLERTLRGLIRSGTPKRAIGPQTGRAKFRVRGAVARGRAGLERTNQPRHGLRVDGVKRKASKKK